MDLLRCEILLSFVFLHTFLTEIEAQAQGFQPTEAQIQAAQQFDRNIRPLLDQVRLKNRLQYGDACNYAIETQRQELGKSFLNSLASINQGSGGGQPDPAEVNERVLQNFRSLASLRGEFCSIFDNLLCSSNGLCECATGDNNNGPKLEFIREDNACVLAPKSACLPENRPIRDGVGSDRSVASNPLLPDSPGPEPRCSKSAPCQIRTTGEFCTLGNSQSEVVKIMEAAEQMDAEARPSFVNEKIRDGICICSGLSLAASGLLLITSVFVSVLNFSKN